MSSAPQSPRSESDLLAQVRAAARQEQFLEVVSADDAKARFEQQLDLAPLPAETVALADALGRVLEDDVVAPIDVPPSALETTAASTPKTSVITIFPGYSCAP